MPEVVIFCCAMHTLDNKSPKIGDSTIGNIADAPEDEKEVQLDVRECFKDLIRLRTVSTAFMLIGQGTGGNWTRSRQTHLQMLVLNTCLVAFQPLYGDSLLTLIQELCSNRRVGHDECNNDTPNTA
jgi:hypothetical protein